MTIGFLRCNTWICQTLIFLTQRFFKLYVDKYKACFILLISLLEAIWAEIYEDLEVWKAQLNIWNIFFDFIPEAVIL